MGHPLLDAINKAGSLIDKRSVILTQAQAEAAVRDGFQINLPTNRADISDDLIVVSVFLTEPTTYTSYKLVDYSTTVPGAYQYTVLNGKLILGPGLPYVTDCRIDYLYYTNRKTIV